DGVWGNRVGSVGRLTSIFSVSCRRGAGDVDVQSEGLVSDGCVKLQLERLPPRIVANLQALGHNIEWWPDLAGARNGPAVGAAADGDLLTANWCCAQEYRKSRRVRCLAVLLSVDRGRHGGDKRCHPERVDHADRMRTDHDVSIAP